MSISLASFIKDKVSNKSALWTNMLVALFLFGIVLFILRVPQDVQIGTNGQRASKELDGMHHPLLDIKAAVSQFQMGGDVEIAKRELERLGRKAESCIGNYKASAAYNNKLSQNISDFTAAYNEWYNAEYDYLVQYSDRNNPATRLADNQYLLVKNVDTDAKFLSTMKLLTDGEPYIHDDIATGRRAYKILQWAGALLVIYLFAVIVVFQRSSKREHIIREKNLEVTLRSIGDAVIATDLQGNITCMNPEAERLTAWKFEDAKGYPLTDVFRVVDENSGVPIGDLVEKVTREKRIVVLAEESMLISSTGKRYQIYENGAPIIDDTGEIIGVVLVFRDISQAHELNRQLIDNANRLQRVIDTSMDAVIVTDAQGMVKDWNPAAASMFGWSYDEIKNQPIHEAIIPEEFREQHLQGVENLINNRQVRIHAKRIESLALHRDGHTFPIELAMTSIRTEKGWILNAFIRDLTDLKQKEASIDKQNVLLRETQHVAKLGYWDFDLLTGEVEWSDEHYRILCLSADAVTPSYDVFMQVVHPEDRKLVDTAYGESLKNKTSYNLVHRVVTEEGTKIVHGQCVTTFDDDGNALRSLGLLQDITEHVNEMGELQLAATTFKTHAGILITDKEGTIVRVNPAFEEMTGYPLQELVGKNPRILQSGKQGKEFYVDMWDRIASKGMWQGELWNKRKDGTLYAEWLTITAVRDHTGEVTNYVGTTQDITERKNAESQITYLAYHDDLTNLANRRLLHDRLHQSIATCKRHNEMGAVLLLDLDQFKDLNDSLGHSVGDEVLRQVASRLKELMREDDTIARLGGDEFVIVLPSVDKDAPGVSFKVQAIAEKIRLSLSEPYKHKNGQCYCNVSIGITLFPGNNDDIDDILKHADTALYRAKARGRNTVCFYQPIMQVEVDSRLAIADGLRKAIKDDEFVLHYQPQIDNKGKLFGAETLIRWQHPEQGMVPPDKFIAVAEDTGLILDIGRWVLTEAARQVKQWHIAGICQQDMLRLAINVSPRQFRQQDFVAEVLRIFEQAEVSPDCIELEVTESLLMDDLEDVVEKMEALRAQGVRISIDDFGTGYSSLSYLRQLPLDQLKIDQSFVQDITTDANDAVVVETIIAMARHLGLNVIAEGVEKKAQLDFLAENGCHAFQGYYFSRPLDAIEFECFVRENSENCLPGKDL